MSYNFHTTRYCDAKGCSNNTRNTLKSFFRFPTDLERRKVWEENLQATESPRKKKFVCSDHFHLRCFVDTFKRRLHRIAVPEPVAGTSDTKLQSSEGIICVDSIKIEPSSENDSDLEDPGTSTSKNSSLGVRSLKKSEQECTFLEIDPDIEIAHSDDDEDSNHISSDSVRGVPPNKFYGSSNTSKRLCDLLTRIEEQGYVDGADPSHAGIYIEPPDTGHITDEDCGDEDGSGTLNNLSGSLLLAQVVPDFDSSDDDLPTVAVKKARTNKINRKWCDRDLNPMFDEWKRNESPGLDELQSKNLTPTQLFELFFDDSVFELAVTESNRYAMQHNKNLDATIEEMKCAIGILLVSGYVQVPRRRMYWENSSDSHCELIAGAMRRNRFDSIFSNMHFADNYTLDVEDKYAKLRPLIEKLNANYLRYAPIEEFYSIDESMCEYFGQHGCKEYLRGKSIRFGFKIWSACTTLGYVLWFEPNQKKNSKKDNAVLGMGEDLVVKFANIIRQRYPLNYHICFDNHFTSLKLMEKLKAMGIKGTGIIKENRIEKCPLVKQNDLRKKARGTCDYKVDETSEIILCRWNDSNIVTMCSNAVGVAPMATTSRFSSAKKGRITVQQPRLVKVYNEHIGGVDRLEQNVNKYRVSIRGKKWYFCLITYFLDQAINNAWQLHRICAGDNQLDLLNFRRKVARFYLESFGKHRGSGQRGRQPHGIPQARFDGMNHWVIRQAKQTRCAQCHSKATTRCEKCDVGLHIKCFKTFHSLVTEMTSDLSINRLSSGHFI